jgi:catechol 2,3-dioxygenase-like lactoylglutathione lyase family enzyme
MITPVLRVRDVDVSLRFYTQVLGFRGDGGLPGVDGKSVYAEAYLGDARLMLARRGGATVCRAELYINLQAGIDELYHHLRAREVPLCDDLHEELWGDRAFTVTDLDGNRLTFAQAMSYASAETVELRQIA